MNIEAFSPKQRRAATWWSDGGFDGIICDGAVRSGKTLACTLGFILWAMTCFDGHNFAICAKTKQSSGRNILGELIPYMRRIGLRVAEKHSEDVIIISSARRRNRFYLFGGMNEASASLIQGMTLAGVLFDEAALMPEAFVSQAMARCSVDGSKFWFNCNPEHPGHWFKTQYIDRCAEKKLLYLHFTMDDNPTLTDDMKNRYKSLYSDRFYRRYVLGEWTVAEGLVYDFMAEGGRYRMPPPEPYERYVVSIDYGTSNPTSMGLWGLLGGVWYRFDEYRHSGAEDGLFKTDEEYADALERLIGDRRAVVIIDPSARSFIEAVRRRGFSVTAANNSVLDGIRRASTMLKEGKMVISPYCLNAVSEFSRYRWQDGACERPVKEFDHTMDEIRYFAAYISPLGRGGRFGAASARR